MSLINSWNLESPKNCLKRAAKSWALRGQQKQDWFWNQHSLLGMGSCSILAIKNIDLFHIKITHIENCFCSVEQRLPLAKKAKSLAWPLAWLAIFTKQNSLPNLWSQLWSTMRINQDASVIESLLDYSNRYTGPETSCATANNFSTAKTLHKKLADNLYRLCNQQHKQVFKEYAADMWTGVNHSPGLSALVSSLLILLTQLKLS